MSFPKFPKFADDQNIVCFYCGLRISGPFQASGHAQGHGSMRGQCTDPLRGCGRVTYFDMETTRNEETRNENEYHVVVRVEGASAPVHVSPWMSEASAEHAKKNHLAMIKDRGSRHVVEIERKAP